MKSQDTINVSDGVIPPAGRVLAVGLNTDLERALYFPAIQAGRVVAEISRFGKMNRDALSKSDVVLSPIVGPDFDAVDMAEYLDDADYRGTYIAVSFDKMVSHVVSGDIKQAAPELAHDVKILRPPPRRGAA